MKLLKSNQIFERIEKKYLLSQEIYQKLQEGLKEYMQIDGYGKHTICNIYYDTENFDLIRRSIEKPDYKEKLRVRSYGIPGEESPSFIEIKKKCKGVVYKRRIELSLGETKAYLKDHIVPKKESQIQKEIDYFLQYYHPVPKMYIAYDRVALFGREDEDIRVTFDEHIRTREIDLDLAKGDYGNLLLKEQQVLMEIKVAGAYPLWMSHLLNELEIYPTSFSKYGKSYQQKISFEQEINKSILAKNQVMGVEGSRDKVDNAYSYVAIQTA